MAGFSLKKGTDTFDFDVFGAVTKGGNPVGTWTTSKDNKIIVNKPDGSQDSYTVTWTFNPDNHLCLSSDGQQSFDFHSVSGNRPFYATNNAVLKVRPDRNHAFGFDLRGEWDMNDHDLSITINGVKSTIDGFILDPKSRFMYHFFDKKNLMQESILGFVGEWEFVNQDGAPMMNFKYKREDGSVDTFSLPKGITINKGFNQFMYQYDKQGHSFGIQFVGLLKINENFQITYAIDRQVTQSGQEQVAATTFTIGVNFVTKNNATGDVEFIVKKTDGTTGTTTLGLKANFTASLGATNLQVSLVFAQVRGPNTVHTTVGFSGSLKFGQNGQIVWQITKDGAATTINIAASDIKLGAARLDARLNVIAQDGHISGVNFLFGVAF